MFNQQVSNCDSYHDMRGIGVHGVHSRERYLHMLPRTKFLES